MTDIDAFRDDEDDKNAAAEKDPTLFYGSADEFVRERLRYMYARRVGPGNASFRWFARWWDYPEALARIDVLWRAWEHLRLVLQSRLWSVSAGSIVMSFRGLLMSAPPA